jgi:ubiquinone biosynthesis protein
LTSARHKTTVGKLVTDKSPTSTAALENWLDVASLLPTRYRRYAPVITQALVFFLEHLDPVRRAAIVQEQLGLGVESSPEQRIVAFFRHCPTLHKLGQTVARDRRLSVELRKRLQSLESLPPSMSVAEILPLIHRELGDAMLGAVELEDKPLAEASVAVVTPFRFHDAETDQMTQGVFKVLKPNIESALDEELILWSQLGALLDETCETHGLPALDYEETLESVATLLRQEVRLEGEQSHLRDAYDRYATSADVRVPRLLPPCTTRVTAMEHMQGIKVTEGAHTSAQRRRLGAVLLEELLARPFWDSAPVAVFHGDPHAGNLLVDQAGRVALLDWSLIARLEKRERVEIVQIVLGALALDAARIRRALGSLSNEPCKESALVPIVDQALRRVRQGEIPGLSWLTDLLDQSLLRAGLRFPPHLTMFRKVLLTLSGVLADLSAEHSSNPVLFGSGLRQFLSEWLDRASGPMSSRAHGTHLSNNDLLGLWAGLPLTASNYWLSGCLDALELVAPKE